MDRSFSLHRGADFEQVWNEGKSWSHPLLILRARANGMARCRFGFVAGKKVGKANQRNRAKRLMREAVRHRLTKIAPGWDVILIARGNTTQATLSEIDTALETLIQRAQLLVNS